MNLKNGPFLRIGFYCLKARATSRRLFTYYHSGAQSGPTHLTTSILEKSLPVCFFLKVSLSSGVDFMKTFDSVEEHGKHSQFFLLFCYWHGFPKPSFLGLPPKTFLIVLYIISKYIPGFNKK